MGVKVSSAAGRRSNDSGTYAQLSSPAAVVQVQPPCQTSPCAPFSFHASSSSSCPTLWCSSLAGYWMLRGHFLVSSFEYSSFFELRLHAVSSKKDLLLAPSLTSTISLQGKLDCYSFEYLTET